MSGNISFFFFFSFSFLSEMINDLESSCHHISHSWKIGDFNRHTSELSLISVSRKSKQSPFQLKADDPVQPNESVLSCALQ